MALAYALVTVHSSIFDRDQRSAVQYAQLEADVKFEELAQQHRLTTVVRNPEPRVMTVPELRAQFPGQVEFTDNVVGLYFTADIS